jgi:hypothetical protein
MIFYVRVNYNKHEGYPMASAYNIDAADQTAAEKAARSRYANDFGFDINHITAKALYTCEEIK